jgi:N utilization substance protein B
MAKITRAEARELLFGLLFETEFKNGENPTEIYELACLDRDIPVDAYIKNTFFGVITRADIIDAVITKYSKGWKAERLSRVSRTVLRIAIYEMLFVDDIHPNVSISQAVALSVKFGEDKAKQFVNGVLSGLFKDIDGKDVKEYIAETAASLAEPEVVGSETAENEENV